MQLNAALLFLAAALDTEVSKTFLSAGAAAQDSGSGPPVYHVKHALVHADDNATATAAANATTATAANATTAIAANTTAPAANATAAPAANATAKEAAVSAEAAAAAQHPDVVEHKKAAGGGYLEGSPLYKGGNGTNAKTDQKFTDDNYPPVSTTMQCVIQLAEQYFLIYSVLAVVNSYNEFAAKPWTGAARNLEAARDTVNFAPMLAVLFLGVRLRALQLSGGDPDKHGLPQEYVKDGMWAATSSVLCQTLLVLIIPFTLGGSPAMGEDGMPVITGGDTLAKVLIVVRWVLMVGLYGGFTTVCVGAFMMEAPTSVYPAGTAPPVSPAVQCTMNLCLQYFSIYLAVAVTNTLVQFRKDVSFTIAKVKVTLNLAKNTVNFAPMLCVLFIGARMRALQIDPVAGNPQAWAQNCMYLCSFAVLFQLLFVVAIPTLFGGHVLGNKDIEGDVAFEVENPTLFWTMNLVRYVIMLAMYSGAIAVIVSICTIEAASGPTPPVSTTMACVINLTIQFFLVYAYLWVLLTLRQAAAENKIPERAGLFIKELLPTAMSATKTVQFCPMLCVLFIGMRLRALQLSDQQGAPQGYVQEAMYLCSYALLIQLVMVFILPIFQSSTMQLNQQTGLVEAKKNFGAMEAVTLAIRYFALLCLYGGACTIVYGLFAIKPSTANGEGNLIPGVAVPKPATPA